MPANAFTDKDRQPTDAGLRKRLGRSYALYGKTLALLREEHRGISTEWKFSTASGWYLTCNKGKRRLFYLFPTEGGFTFKMVFGEKSLQQIRDGGFPDDILEMIREAKKYPEGTLIVFDRRNFKVDTMLRLLRIKITG